eukprot:jgi/Botrbrau1/19686/Bobra.0003s0047.1
MGHISSSSPGVKEETAMGATLKPLLRGVSHQHAFFAAVSAGAMLVLSAPTKEGKLACLIYAATLSTLFGVSAVYHRRTWNPEARALMRRLDHSSIFLLIAGTYTPLCVVSLHQTVSRRLLWWVWAGALAGISQKLLWIKAPKWVSTGVYLMLGWAVVPHVKGVAQALGPLCGALLLAGGLCYSVGAIIYAAKYPDPAPQIFGYHEIFHALVIAASIFHFAVIYMVVHGMLPKDSGVSA